MEHLPNGYTLHIPEGAFPLSTDSMALAQFVKLPKGARVLDLGSGCATLGLLLCSRDPNCTVTGVELTPAAHQAALDNIRVNALEDRLTSICADGAQVPALFAPGSFSVCVSNPPYYSGGPSSRELAAARKESTLDAATLMKSAAWALKFGGDLFVVHKPERLAQLIALGAEQGLECKRLRLLRHRENDPVSLVLLQLRKGARPGLILEEAALYHSDGTPTQTYAEIYHTEEA